MFLQFVFIFISAIRPLGKQFDITPFLDSHPPQIKINMLYLSHKHLRSLRCYDPAKETFIFVVILFTFHFLATTPRKQICKMAAHKRLNSILI